MPLFVQSLSLYQHHLTQFNIRDGSRQVSCRGRCAVHVIGKQRCRPEFIAHCIAAAVLTEPRPIPDVGTIGVDITQYTRSLYAPLLKHVVA